MDGCYQHRPSRKHSAALTWGSFIARRGRARHSVRAVVPRSQSARMESWSFALWAAVLALILGVFFQPWSAFIPTPREFAYWDNDSDYTYWRLRLRVMGMVWAFVFVMAARAVAHYVKRKRHEVPSI